MSGKIIGLCLCLLLIEATCTASATCIFDHRSDVWHWSQIGSNWSWSGNVRDKPDIDIKRVSCSVNHNKLMLSLNVVGSIRTSGTIVYWVFFNTSDTQYFLSYSNGSGCGCGIKGSNFTVEDNITVWGGTLRVVLDVLGDTTQVDLWGYAAEYTTIGDVTSEWWGDWAPNSKASFSKKAFLFGSFVNLSHEGGYVSFESTNIRVFFLNPFQSLRYFEGERITFIGDTAKAMVFPRFIVGVVDVITESHTSFVSEHHLMR
jgi:hypothetical protein